MTSPTAPEIPLVYLNRIYTKTGDAGETGLGDGSRVSKTHPRVVAYGTVDELNSVLGLAVANGQFPEDVRELIRSIQNDLFDVGADLCVPPYEGENPETSLRVVESQVTRLERAIDGFNERLQPLNSFILPGGTPAAAFLHLARTVCRRAEIEVVRIPKTEAINEQVVCYLNRLSDLLFVVGRICNDDGRGDVLWTPGKNR
ncbi:Cob(I)yrinic acid a,c-diamide adenosyltransferase [Caulifigura coniformis]|uniref:Corrinoid adenosyltransferase n=1 Tax=Caulifigura coniformis TaxID=2527983 RepID=A0A517SLZ5_9PLAN|nr:cob(I)yrinic acid a,c-diamide adenosyltransferase [Caulifigura coniformis]QDT57156.1 Cob(I)yrinic acid a,c-diamide adenosyltransferase [Caulifigura coniformis]